jgi:hypothetical protein
MDDSQNKKSYLVIGIVFLVVCAVGVIIYYATKDNTKTENFLMGDVPEITKKIITPSNTEKIKKSSMESCQEMIDSLIDMHECIMGTKSNVNYRCTTRHDDSFFDTLHSILQVPTLQILNNATSIDNLDKTNLINLWMIEMNVINDPSLQITPFRDMNSDGILCIISDVKMEQMKPTGNVFISASDFANVINRGSVDKSYPRFPLYEIPPSYKQSLIDISKRAEELLAQQHITIDDLKGDHSNTITADNMIKLLLIILVRNGTFFPSLVKNRPNCCHNSHPAHPI